VVHEALDELSEMPIAAIVDEALGPFEDEHDDL
jgi:hypothetical protein